MASAGVAERKQKSLQDAELKEALQQLRRTDNWTNWLYLARTYLFLAAVLGAAVGFDLYRQSAGWSAWWDVPVFVVAIVLVGAGQHQLSGLAHEGAHHILFRNRVLNEVASDWLCMFPLFTSTHHYRLQHLAHHQFVNDPVRDPDVSQLRASGHWLPFPLPKRDFLKSLLKQLWPPNLVRFMRVRAAYNSTHSDRHPYRRQGAENSKLGLRVGLVYVLVQSALFTALVYLGDPFWLAVLPAGWYAAVMGVYALLPIAKFHQSRVHPPVSRRWMSMLRVTFFTLLFGALAWATYATGRRVVLYFAVLWVVPLFTSFSFFMVLRQLVQHGNGDRGWLSNTRVFFVNRLISFAVFPIGQDYHLPHHLFATVPHYRLRELHEMLLEYPEYREQAVEVHGYFLPPERPPRHPTVLDVVGPEYAPRGFRGVHVDNSVLEGCEVEGKEEILREAEEEVRRAEEDAGNGLKASPSPPAPGPSPG
jgi:fatty acid desaturase